MSQLLGSLLKQAINDLELHDIADARSSARLLLADCLGIGLHEIDLRAEMVISPEHQVKFQNQLKRRKNNEPVAYILGHQPFRDLDLSVTPDVLIPRPETEQLVDLVINYVSTSRPAEPITIVDVGTGSGAIALSLAKSLGDRAKIIATDTSRAALDVATKNNRINQLNVSFIEADLLTTKHDAALIGIDILVANLPYIPTARIGNLQNDVKNFEPHGALDGGTDGLAIYRRLFDQLNQLAFKPRALFLEVDESHSQLIPIIVADTMPDYTTEIKNDLSGLARFAVLMKQC